MTPARRAVVGLVSLALVAGIGALTRVPYATGSGTEALLRLSWQARGERVERCRRATAEELAARPAHMRQEVICEGRQVAPYTLRIAVDGRVVDSGRVAGSGMAGEGTLYVLRELPVAPGSHRLSVRFEREPDGTGADSSALHDARRRTVPPRLTMDTTITLGAGEVVLVTYAPELERLLVLAGR